MKKTLAIVIAAALFTPHLVAQGEKKAGIQVGPAAGTKIAAKDIGPDEAEKLIAEGALVLDVRVQEEFAHQRIKGAVNVNVLDHDFEVLVAAVDQTKPVIVHCQSGKRSVKALAKMNGKVKFPAVYHLKDGFLSWKAAKKPFESFELPGAKRVGPVTPPGTVKPAEKK